MPSVLYLHIITDNKNKFLSRKNEYLYNNDHQVLEQNLHHIYIHNFQANWYIHHFYTNLVGFGIRLYL